MLFKLKTNLKLGFRDNVDNKYKNLFWLFLINKRINQSKKNC